jgi:hypothetical protein
LDDNIEMDLKEKECETWIGLLWLKIDAESRV